MKTRVATPLLHYLEYNPQGQKTVLLLHGLGATGESWRLQVPYLVEAGYHVLAPDARGFGRSPYPGGTSIQGMADDIAALLDHLGRRPVHVVGISMGGTLALALALNHSALVDHLVLVNTFARLRPKSLSGWLYMISRFLLVHLIGLETQGRLVVQRIFPLPDQELFRQELMNQIRQANPGGYRAAMRALGRFNVLDRLGEIKAPTLVLTGANDTTVRPTNQEQLMVGIHGAHHVIIRNAGHAVSVDQPDIFNQEVTQFLLGKDPTVKPCLQSSNSQELVL